MFYNSLDHFRETNEQYSMHIMHSVSVEFTRIQENFNDD